MRLQGLILLSSFSYIILAHGRCPNQCSCRRNGINCSDRSLMSLNVLDLGLIQSFDYLDISKNQLTRLPLLEVKFINASVNEIQLFPDIADGVESLSLRYNKLRDISVKHCPITLQGLDLSENPIKDIDIACNGLLVLDLSHCDIEILTDNFLKALPSLQVLNIGDNPLKKINGDLFSYSLLELRIERTQLRALKPTVLNGLAKLKFLDLSGNKHLHLMDLNAQAEILIAKNCSLERVLLTGMPNLRVAVVDHNLINYIDFADSLTELRASNNLITEIFMHNLKKADLSYNLLNDLKLRPMEWLNISGNQLSKLKLSSMHLLEATHCKLRTIEASNSRIYFLNLSHNELEDFPGGLRASIVDVSFNRLSAFKSRIEGIVELRLSGNRLVLAEDVVAQGRMYLNDNPWTCDCKMDHLYRLAEDPNSLICAHPRNVSGKTWSDACYRSKIPRWMLNHPYIPFIISTAILLFIIFSFYWIRRRLDISDQQTEEDHVVETVLPHVIINDQLPSYEEALLMPGLAKKVNVVTQTRSYEVLSRRLSSNSI